MLGGAARVSLKLTKVTVSFRRSSMVSGESFSTYVKLLLPRILAFPLIFRSSGLPLMVELKSIYSFPYTSPSLVRLAFSNSKLRAFICRLIPRVFRSTSPLMTNGVCPLVKILKRLNFSLLLSITSGWSSILSCSEACGTLTPTLSRFSFPLMTGLSVAPEIDSLPSRSPESKAIRSGMNAFARFSGRCSSSMLAFRKSFSCAD